MKTRVIKIYDTLGKDFMVEEFSANFNGELRWTAHTAFALEKDAIEFAKNYLKVICHQR